MTEEIIMSGEMELKPLSEERCERCGELIDVTPGVTFVGATDGRVWHYGCAPSRNRTPTLTAVSVEAVAKAIAEASRRIGPDDVRSPDDTWQMMARHVLAALSIPREDGVTELLDALEAIKELADADETFLCWKTANDALESYTAMRAVAK